MKDNNIKTQLEDSKSKRWILIKPKIEVYKAPTSVLETTSFNYGNIKIWGGFHQYHQQTGQICDS